MYDAWESVDRWLWCLCRRWEPNIIRKRDELGVAPDTYITETFGEVHKGILYRHDYHREELIGEAMAHLVATDRKDRAYMEGTPEPKIVIVDSTISDAVLKQAVDLADKLVNELVEE